MDGESILEVKRHLDGRHEVFTCQALAMTTERAIVRFVNPQPVGTDPSPGSGLALPAGTATTAFFWRRRHYNLYRFLAPDGRLLGHRFDVVDDVRLGRGRIEYLDLLLDVRMDADGRLWVEDEDEVAEYAARGLLTPQQVALIQRTGHYITLNYERIIAGALTVLGRLR